MTRKTYRLYDETIEFLHKYMEKTGVTVENEAVNRVFKSLDLSFQIQDKYEKQIEDLNQKLMRAIDRARLLENQLNQYNQAINGLRLIIGTHALLENVEENQEQHDEKGL